MNLRNTFVLFGVLLTMLLVFGIVLELRKGAAVEAALFPSLVENDSAQFSEVILKQGKDEYRFRYDPKREAWTLRYGKETWRIDKAKIEDLIRQVRTLEKNPAADPIYDPAEAGLSPPQLTVTLVMEETGQKFTLYVGRKSGDGSNRYVKSSERLRRISGVKADDLSALDFDDIREFRERTLLAVSPSSAQRLAIVRREGSKTMAVAEKNGIWRFQQPKYLERAVAAFTRSGDDKDKPALRDLIDKIGRLDVASVKDFQDLGNHDFAYYGVEDGSETLKIEVKYTTGFGEKASTVEETLWIGKKVIREKKDDKKLYQYYARLGTDDYVVRIDEERLTDVFKAVAKPEEYRSFDLAHFELSEPDAVLVKAVGQTVLFGRTEPEVWYISAGQEKLKASASTVHGDSGLLAALQSKGKVQEYFYPDKEGGPAKLDAKLGVDEKSRQAEVSVYVDGLEHPKKEDLEKDSKTPAFKIRKDAKAKVTFVFGKDTGKVVYVKRIDPEGPTSWLAVPREVLQRVLPPGHRPFYLAFLDKALPPFELSRAEVVELVRRRDKTVETFKFRREKKTTKKDGKETQTETWTMLEPKSWKRGPDEANLKQVIRKLEGLKVEDWIHKGPDKQSLADYGLDSPILRISVTLASEEKTKEEPQKKDEKGEKKEGAGNKGEKSQEPSKQPAKSEKTEPRQRTYSFGKKQAGDKGEPGRYYAMVSDKDIVFLADEATIKSLREIELRNRTVLDLDAKKILTLDVKWQDGKGGIVRLALERKSAEDAWKVKTIEGFDKKRFELDKGRVEVFLERVTHVKAKWYEQVGGKPKPSHQLAADKAPLVCEFKTADGKTHHLRFGAETKRDGLRYYFATASSIPDAVFAIEAFPYDAPRRGINFFNAKAIE